ncbi:MAG: hypothetical protein JWM47_1958 [Acidimicrobiales bacterium]|nr:hypothetical protein [Acidimicrobiales bacterium]
MNQQMLTDQMATVVVSGAPADFDRALEELRSRIATIAPKAA